MQPRGGMALDVVAQPFFSRGGFRPARLRRDGEVTHLAIALESLCHATRGSKARARPVIATAAGHRLQRFGAPPSASCHVCGAWHGLCSTSVDSKKGTPMGPAIALRLRQHLTLTPQVQQALKLLQMSALEFAQEMEQALTANPFLEENPDAPPPALRDAATTVDDVVVPQEPSGGGGIEREQDDCVGARSLEECLCLQLLALPAQTPGREAALRIVKGNLNLLANREWARLQHAAGCDEATLHTARALIRSLDPRPGHRFGPQEARYVVPDVIVKKQRDRWVAIINPASLPRVRLNRAYAEAIQSKNGSNQSLP